MGRAWIPEPSTFFWSPDQDQALSETEGSCTLGQRSSDLQSRIESAAKSSMVFVLFGKIWKVLDSGLALLARGMSVAGVARLLNAAEYEVFLGNMLLFLLRKSQMLDIIDPMCAEDM